MGFERCLVTIDEYSQYYNDIQVENFRVYNSFGYPIPIKINFEVIKQNYFKFINLRDSIKRKNFFMKYDKLMDMRLCLNNSKIFLISKIEPINNEYISLNAKEHYKWFIDSIGRIDAQLDSIEIDLFSSNTQIVKENEKTNFKAWFVINEYKRVLEECFTNIVILPLERALIRIINAPSKKKINEEYEILVKDTNLLYYLYFLEAYQASLVLGSLTRAIHSTRGAIKGVVQTNPITNIYESPTAENTDIKTIREQKINIEEEFKEPESFKMEENAIV
jgi:hypothetical protein